MLLEYDEHWLVKNLWSEKWLLKVFNNPPHPKVIQRHTGQSFTELYLLEICPEKRPKLIFSEVFGKHIVKFWCEALYCSSAFKPPVSSLSGPLVIKSVSISISWVFWQDILFRILLKPLKNLFFSYFLMYSHTQLNINL